MAEMALLAELDREEGETGSLTQKAYRQIEELVVTLRLPPGAVLSETALAKQLEIGRTPIREALQRLAREGLIAVLPRRGILVSEISVKRQLRLVEVRRELERLMAKAAARRADAEERAAFREMASGMRRAAETQDDITFMRYDRQLNLLLCRAARNEYLTSAMGLTQGLSRRFWYSHYKQVADLPLCARLHAELADAVAAGEKSNAEAASDRLLAYVEAFTRAALDADSRV
jgi:DNA-binding GntR family transcriptional regulator